jgi:hypothetical protein
MVVECIQRRQIYMERDQRGDRICRTCQDMTYAIENHVGRKYR